MKMNMEDRIIQDQKMNNIQEMENVRSENADQNRQGL